MSTISATTFNALSALAGSILSPVLEKKSTLAVRLKGKSLMQTQFGSEDLIENIAEVSLDDYSVQNKRTELNNQLDEFCNGAAIPVEIESGSRIQVNSTSDSADPSFTLRPHRNSTESLDAISTPKARVEGKPPVPPRLKTKFSSGSKPENLAWVFAQMVGQITIDTNYVRESSLEELKHLVMYKIPGSAGSTVTGGGSLDSPSNYGKGVSSIPASVNAPHTFTILNTPPSIILCDAIILSDETKTCMMLYFNRRFIRNSFAITFTTITSRQNLSN